MTADKVFKIAAIPADGVGKEVVAAGPQGARRAVAAAVRTARSPSTGPSSPGARTTTPSTAG